MAEPRAPVLVLGSASPARATLLRNAGVAPLVRHSRVDEESLTRSAGIGGRAAGASDAGALTQLLATAKARDVAEQVRAEASPAWHQRRVLVVGADSMLAVGDRVLGKAGTAQEVRTRWSSMAGRTGVLVTGHAVIDLASGRLVEQAVATTVHFGRPSPQELAAYIASGEPFEVAGSCTIDGLGGAFIDGIEGDHTNVIGLSLPGLRALLGALGVRWTDLWSPA